MVVSEPSYSVDFAADVDVNQLLQEIPWEERTSTRRECFMADGPPLAYTYGKGEAARTYHSLPPHALVVEVLLRLNRRGHAFNVCFLNRYDDLRQELGWHADDSPTMDHAHPIGVASFGAAREIWWRPNGTKGETPPDRRRRLAHGSLFLMPAGFQQTHQHRIPRGDRVVGPRVSMTFRRFRVDAVSVTV